MTSKMFLDWLVVQLNLQRPQIFLWCPVFMGLGIIAYFCLGAEPNEFVAIGALAAPFIGLALFRNHQILRYFLLLLLCAGVGFAASKLRSEMVYTPILQKKIGPVDVIGTIDMIEHFAESEGVRVVLKDVEIERLDLSQTPRKVRIKFRSAGDLEAGQRIKVLAGLNPPSSPSLPGGFDFQRYMYFKSIGAVGFSYGQGEIIGESSKGHLHSWLQNLRADIAVDLSDRLGPSGGVAGALMVGHKAGIVEEDKEAMREAGLAHMLAISGLHIGLFFGALFFSVRLLLASSPTLALNYPIKKLAGVAAMAGAVFYMMVAGATIPTQRAVLMTSVVFVAILLDRTPLSMRLVAFAALVILLIAPESLLSASFQMSFSAVAALVGFYSAIRPWWASIHRQSGFMRRAGLYLLGVSMTTIVATFATAPFALFHFQQLAVYSLLANILAMPLLAFVVMPFAVLFFVLLPFGLEGLTLPVMGWGVERIVEIAHFVSSLDYAVLQVTLWPSFMLALFCAGFLIILLVEGHLKVMALIPLTLFMSAFFVLKQPDILVSSTSYLIAVKEKSGSLSFSNFRKERFVRAQWGRAYGLKEGEALKWPKEGQQSDLNCGEDGCRLERGEHKVSFLRNIQAFEEECSWADLLIASDPAPECKGTKIIDRFDVFRNGAYALYLGKDVVIQNTEEGRGQRLWVAKHQARQERLQERFSDKSASN